MIGYLARRLAQSIVVLFGISFISFGIFQFAGDPIRANYNVQELTQDQITELRERMGLDEPFYVQYANWLGDVAQGDFGLSYRQRLPVMQLILERVPATVELATLALFSGTLLGIALGVWSAVRPRSASAKAVIVTSLLGISTPTFVVGLLLILLLSIALGWLPPFGRGETVTILGGWDTGLLTASGWRHLVMPVVTLGLFQIGVMARLTRSGMLEALSQDYVRTARAKGLRSGPVVVKHALRNVLIPVITVLGMSYGELIAFSIVTETIFQWPGLGLLLLDAVFAADRPVVVAYIMLTAIVILGLNLIVDLLYAVLDPRIRYA